MSINDQDTDPSSPEARRQTPEPGLAAESPESGPMTKQSPRAATTDPGVGPPSPPSSTRAFGVVVPPVSGRGIPVSSATGGTKDSVELLLEGMGGPRPDRTKTMPQTAGEASAAYHAEHAVRAGRTARDEGRKVLVDTIRLRPPTDEGELALRPGAADPTFVLSTRLGPRIVVATIAGFLVVLAIFAYLDREPQQGSASVAPPPQPPAVAAAAPVPAAASTENAASPATNPEPAPTTAAAASTDPSPAPPAAMATRPRGAGGHRQSPGDVGEFKTTF
jgi:hypothetical protein